INTLPVRVRVGDGSSVAAVVRRMHEQLTGLLRHEHAPLPLAQRCSGIRPPTPLFAALLNYRHSEPPAEARSTGPDAAPAGIRRLYAEARTNYPVTLSVDDWGTGLTVNALVPASVGAERVGAMVLQALQSILDALEAAPGRTAPRVDVLPAAERSRVLREWNATEADYPRDRCVHELFEAQVRRSPDAAAVVSAGEVLTYGELNRRANRLARSLAGLGVRPETAVGVCLERGADLLVALLATLKAGGAYVALDPAYPQERLRHMLADSAPAGVLTQAALAGRLGGTGAPVLALDADHASWAGHSGADLEGVGIGPGHLAYVLYTSGSTGRPKGVMLEHGSVVNRLAWMQRTYRLDGHDAMLQKTTYSFDVSVWELFWPLFVGARVVLARPEGQRDPAYLAETIRRERITLVHFVPSMLPLFLDDARAPLCTSLEQVFCSGEALTAALVRQLRERLPAPAVHNFYGPTEAGEVTAWSCPAHAVPAAVPIGAPVANTQVYVLDGAGEPAPVGVAGELYIGGEAVGRGYRNRPELTAERFVPDPFSPLPGARLYRTGDLCRWLADGSVDYLGRRDAQIKVRGFRVELGEIEARLAEHGAVREAAVLPREDAPGNLRLVAYYVAAEAIGAEEMRAHLSGALPDYMVPAAFVQLEELPLTPNGKLDRKALPAPDADAYARRGYEAPEGETEQALAEIWAEVLRVERVGRWDHFFELGGHSLLAVQVMSRARQTLGVEAALGEVFAQPVLADFARALDRATRAELPPIERADRSGRLPLSFAQQRLWFLEQLGELGSTYHMPQRLRLRGELNRLALVRALDRLVARHEPLRTVFAVVDGEPEQRIARADESAFRLVEHDLCGRPEQETELRRLMAEEANAPFDLARGPLIRGRLVQLAGDEHVLLLTLHHVVSDAWSGGVLRKELGALYAAFCAGREDPLPELPVQYADYAAWQRRWVDGEVLARQAAYWEGALAGAPELLELPTDRPRPARQSFAGGAVSLDLGEELSAGLRALSRRQGTTLFHTLLAGWAVVLGRLSGQEDVVVGTPTANRGRRASEGLIGFFVNT
ncbi:MAG TPA: amino acid adenylation domain-containing protein, partial [Longimicrobiaceae bacterium]|nr:amino acid adenylation domain-containing protein [Longimicrobiaceae bacterium]